ncbi:Phosphate-induced protein [Trema orientale]|uniref:Phosphate-induced protein n=1 Tax=Trema orientale TaxID=63057 RepID=A0A2P5FIK1_TREOI|nr:Phosphate-induced protein [Trema orientale]
MASRTTQGQGLLHIPNENLHIHPKKPVVDVKAKGSITTTKKGGAALGTRKALTDITNKAPLLPNASSKKNASTKQEVNVAEEMFLHDHNKCIEAQKIELNSFQLDLVLPGDDINSLRCYPEPEELSMAEFSDWLESSNRWESPPCSPLHGDSPPFSVFPWRIEELKRVLLLLFLLRIETAKFFSPSPAGQIPSQFLPQFSCFSWYESSSDLYYHGGKIITEPVNVSLLWFGTGWQESDKEAIRNAITSLTSSRYDHVEDSDVPTLGNWWEITRQYGDSNNVSVTDTVNLGAECFYTGPEINVTRDQVLNISQSVFNRNSTQGFGKNLSCTRVFKANEYGIYQVVFSSTVMFLYSKEQLDLMGMCNGKYEVKVSEGVTVNVTWARAPQNSLDQCSLFFRGDSYLGPPNGDEKIDSVVAYLLANVAEEVTNGDGRGWFSNDGSEFTISSSCDPVIWREKDSGPPLFRDAEMNLSFNAVGLNGYRYMVHYLWDQRIRNCALKLSDTCGTNAVIFRQPKGYIRGGTTVNHTDGLQPYPPNQICRWEIDYPDAKFISFTINYNLISADDHVQLCMLESDLSLNCQAIKSTTEVFKNTKLMGSKAHIEFKSGNQVPLDSRGWELSYSAGSCNGKTDIYNRDGIIGYTSTSGLAYEKGLSCQWVLHGKPGTPVSVNFTQINIIKDLDFVAIYGGTVQQIANFTGFYSSFDLPRMNLSGLVMIAFSTQTDEGKGWSAKFHISSPDTHHKKWLPVILATVLGFVLVSVSLASIALTLLRRKAKRISRTKSDEGVMLMNIDILDEENQIGEGPSAVVYRAVSADRGLVAVKCLRNRDAQTELEQEILLKSSLHPNIISLVGITQDGFGRQHLIFEFMSGKDLAQNLKERGETLNWDKRLTIALQICSAIQMLHIYLKPPVYHGNVTSENVLLDEFCAAKLGGFRVANYCSSSREEPHQRLSEMAEDIRLFGLLLFELLTGEPLVNRQASSDCSSLEEINELIETQAILDGRLDYPNEKCKIMALTKLGEIAKWCIGSSLRVEGYKSNPNIVEVLSGLTQVKHLFCSVSG